MLFAPLAGRDVKPFAPPFGLPDLTARPHPAAYIAANMLKTSVSNLGSPNSSPQEQVTRPGSSDAAFSAFCSCRARPTFLPGMTIVQTVGGLVSYGVDLGETFPRAAEHQDGTQAQACTRPHCTSIASQCRFCVECARPIRRLLTVVAA